jgi:hypothetical protein
MRVDMNGNGSFTDVEDRTYTLPVEVRQGINYSLSPERRSLFVSTDGQFVCGGLQIRFLDLPPAGGAAVVTHVDCLPGGLPFNGTSVEYFETFHHGNPPVPPTFASPQRVAWVVTGGEARRPEAWLAAGEAQR